MSARVNRRIVQGLDAYATPCNKLSYYSLCIVQPLPLAGTHARRRHRPVPRDRSGGLGFQGSLSNVVGLELVSTC